MSVILVSDKCKKVCVARRTHSETITITLARKQKLTTDSNVSEAIQQPSSVKYEQKSDAGRDIKHYLEERTHSETITITLARTQKLTTESNVSEAIQQPSSVKYEQKSYVGRDIKHNLE